MTAKIVDRVNGFTIRKMTSKDGADIKGVKPYTGPTMPEIVSVQRYDMLAASC